MELKSIPIKKKTFWSYLNNFENYLALFPILAGIDVQNEITRQT